MLRDRLGDERLHKVLLLRAGSSRFVNVQDRSALYAYEIVNFVDGKKSVTLRGATVAQDFKKLVIDYIERRYGTGGAGRTAAE